MTGTCRAHIVLAALAVVVLLTAVTGAQTAPAAPETSTAPAPKLKQPAEFTSLAAKAAKVKSLHARGVVTIKGLDAVDPKKEKDGAKGDPKVRQAGFQVWLRGKLSQLKADAPIREQRVTDGKYAYVYRSALRNVPATAERRSLARGNLYQSASFAGILLDAVNGYQDLASSSKFVPLPDSPELDKEYGKLKWFRLEPATSSVHPVLRGDRRVVIGINPTDGIARVLIGTRISRRKTVTEIVFFEKVRIGPVRDEDLKLTSDAAKASWRDIDFEKPRPIDAPMGVIVRPKS